MKTIRLILLFLFCPLTFFAQSLTGLWTGSLSNDSASVRKDQSFEIVLTQYKDKVYGYSRATFIVNDTLFYIVKRVKGSIDGNTCEVKDDDIVAYNFKGRIDKGIKMVSTFHFDEQDSTWKMDGEWRTNKTKKYYSVSGKMDLQEEKDLEKSRIIPHLEELKLADDVAVYKEAKKNREAIAKASLPAPTPVQKNEPVKKETALANQQADKTKPAEDSKATASNKTNEPPVVKTEKPSPVNPKQNKKENSTASNKPSPEKDQPVKNEITSNRAPDESKATVKQEPLKTETKAETNPPQKQEPVVIAKTKKEDPAGKIEKEKNNTSPVIIKPEAPAAAALVNERKVAPPQVVNFSSDSLILALYDNGEIDGDTVSVLLNGEIILARQGLKASAIKKTIYVPAGSSDSMTLVLYAENLGKYPPNTGLLVIHDGEDTYQVRFSADLQQNAAVIFKRKRK